MTRREIAKILRSHLMGVDGYGAVRLGAKLGVTARTVERWCSDETRPLADELVNVVTAVGEDDPVRAAALWRDLSALVGQESRPAPRCVPVHEVELGVLDVQSEAGDVAHALRQARDPESPGGRDITPGEAAEIGAELHDVEIAAVVARAGAMGQPTPQLARLDGTVR